MRRSLVARVLLELRADVLQRVGAGPVDRDDQRVDQRVLTSILDEHCLLTGVTAGEAVQMDGAEELGELLRSTQGLSGLENRQLLVGVGDQLGGAPGAHLDLTIFLGRAEEVVGHAVDGGSRAGTAAEALAVAEQVVLGATVVEGRRGRRVVGWR